MDPSAVWGDDRDSVAEPHPPTRLRQEKGGALRLAEGVGGAEPEGREEAEGGAEEVGKAAAEASAKARPTVRTKSSSKRERDGKHDHQPTRRSMDSSVSKCSRMRITVG